MLKKLLVTVAAAAAVSVPLAGVASADPPSGSGSNDNVIVAGGNDVPPSKGLSTLKTRPFLSTLRSRIDQRLPGAPLDSLSEMGEMESLRLQMAMDRQSKMMSTLSNLLKKVSDTSAAITQNIK